MEKQPFDTVIISGGSIQTEFALRFLEEEKRYARAQAGKLRLIAADSGLDFFRVTGLKPDLIVGDFDSLSDSGREYLHTPEIQNRTEILKLNVEKDDSDTQSAVTHAVCTGSRSIAILGATGSRFDHVLANIGLLMWGKEKGVRIAIIDPNNYITLAESGTILEKSSQFGDFVSFFPLGGPVCGLTLDGFRYPLKNHDLKTSDSGLTVSNEIREETASVTYRSGALLMIMSKDR